MKIVFIPITSSIIKRRTLIDTRVVEISKKRSSTWSHFRLELTKFGLDLLVDYSTATGIAFLSARWQLLIYLDLIFFLFRMSFKCFPRTRLKNLRQFQIHILKNEDLLASAILKNWKGVLFSPNMIAIQLLSIAIKKINLKIGQNTSGTHYFL